MDEETDFKDFVLRAAKAHLELVSENLPLRLDVKLNDISIDRQSIEFVDNEIKDKLIPVTRFDFRPDAQLYVEINMEVMGRNVIAPIIFNISKEYDMELEDSKAEIATITPEDETNFKDREPFLQRLFDSVILFLFVEAIKFGFSVAIEFFK